MKYKLLCLAILATITLTGCRTSERVRSTKAYKEAVMDVQKEFAKEGYQLYDTKRTSDIDGSKQDTYKFRDTVGNTMEYTVNYTVKNDDNVYYVENVQVDGCMTSNINDYEQMCGSDSPINKIENLKKDEKISHVSAGKTIFFLVGLPAIIVLGLGGIIIAGLAAG